MLSPREARFWTLQRLLPAALACLKFSLRSKAVPR